MTERRPIAYAHDPGLDSFRAPNFPPLPGLKYPTAPSIAAMPYWFEVFDNEEVQRRTRQQATRLTGAMAALGVGSFGILALGLLTAVPLPLLGLLLLALWMATVRWVHARLSRLRRVERLPSWGAGQA